MRKLSSCKLRFTVSRGWQCILGGAALFGKIPKNKNILVLSTKNGEKMKGEDQKQGIDERKMLFLVRFFLDFPLPNKKSRLQAHPHEKLENWDSIHNMICLCYVFCRNSGAIMLHNADHQHNKTRIFAAEYAAFFHQGFAILYYNSIQVRELHEIHHPCQAWCRQILYWWWMNIFQFIIIINFIARLIQSMTPLSSNSDRNNNKNRLLLNRCNEFLHIEI